MTEIEINHHDTITISVARIRAIAHLLTGYQADCGLPMDCEVWLQIGHILDELGEKIESANRNLEEPRASTQKTTEIKPEEP